MAGIRTEPDGHGGNGRDEQHPGVHEDAGRDVETAPTPLSAGPAPVAAREAAVEAYCRELCGAERMRVAADEVIASPRLSGPPATVPERELLRVTRATASGFAPLVPHPGVRSLSTHAAGCDCGFTLPRLARRDNGELDRHTAAGLGAHLEGCLICRAAEARHDRAARAFTAVLGIALAGPPVPEAPAVAEILIEPPAAAAEGVAAVVEEPPTGPEEAVVEEQPHDDDPEPVRGLVVLPATPAAAAVAPAPTAAATPTGRLVASRPVPPVGHRATVLGAWSVLIATLVAGALVIVVIALLWSNGSSAPTPRSLPPARAASSAAVLGAVAHRSAPTVRRAAARRT